MFNNAAQQTACHTCSQLTPIKIKSPSNLLSCIEMMKKLIHGGEFEMESSNFELTQPKTSYGCWQNDLMYCSIRCKACGQLYSCVCDTYHGSGRFGKGK